MALNTRSPIRCHCNKLLFTRSGDTIEIKCNKCKRILRIETAGIISMTFRQDESDPFQFEGASVSKDDERLR